MSDVTCPTCGEPWEAYYLRHDLGHEVSDDPPPGNPAADAKIRAALEEQGWHFLGGNVLVFDRCPCCPPDAESPNDETGRIAARAEIAHLLGDDLDGLEATLEDLGL